MKAKKKYEKEIEELWSKIRYLISPITKNSHYYDKKHIKMKLNSDNELPLNKIIEILNMAIV